MAVDSIFDYLNIPSEHRHESIRRKEGEFIQAWIHKKGLTNALEIGLAYGASAACILSNPNVEHTGMDPFQKRYANLGLKNIEALGFKDRFIFYEDYSHNVLPRLVEDERSYDFAFVDGGHRFDQVFLNFYYVDLLLEKGGYVLFHDSWMRGVQLVASFIKTNRKNYRFLKCPVSNLILFEKCHTSENHWTYFKEFYTFKGIFSHKTIAWMIRGGLLQRLSKHKLFKRFQG